MHNFHKYLISCFAACALFCGGRSFAQQLPPAQPDPPKNWFALDLQKDGYFGISLSQAYDFLKGKQSKPVVVAIIDSGVDTLQQDLQGILWINPKKTSRGDVHGWNYLGGPGRKCDFNETEEEVRQYFKLKDKYTHLTKATAPDKKEHDFWLKVKVQYDSTLTKAKAELPQLSPIFNALVQTSGMIRAELKLKNDQTFSR